MKIWALILVLTFLAAAPVAFAAAPPVRLLIVPGHDAVNWGTDYRGVKEADLTLALGQDLFDWLNNDKNFQVYSARDFSTGDYNPDFARYFEDASTSINSFRQSARTNFTQALESGAITPIVSPPHDFASAGVAYVLNGLNKWANDNRIDLAIHLHLNDYPGHDQKTPGKYSGFTVYVPASQFNNGAASERIADQIFATLQTVSATSTYPPEAAGVVPDQDLIAIGSNNSRTGASLLVEYGYIYETPIINPAVRPLYFKELAYQTYRGLSVAFGLNPNLPPTILLPYTFNTDLKLSDKPKPEVLRLQKALQESGFYPPAGQALSDCPLSGLFGSCTRLAVTAFQKKYKLPGTGYVGALTRGQLNRLYSQ